MRNGYPVSAAIWLAIASANPGGAFRPVPTAVPPAASSYSPSAERVRFSVASSSCRAYPDHSWPTVSGTASSRWVRPILTTSRHSSAFAAMARCSAVTLGSTSSWMARTAATCIAVGNVSLEDCAMFTWSLGWIGALLPICPPVSWIARLLMTSLTFMFVWVPEPVCQTRSGK